MRYDVDYLTDDKNHDSLLCRASYRSDKSAIDQTIDRAKYYNRTQKQFSEHKINRITIYRLVKRNGDVYWKTVVSDLPIE